MDLVLRYDDELALALWHFRAGVSGPDAWAASEAGLDAFHSRTTHGAPACLVLVEPAGPVATGPWRRTLVEANRRLARMKFVAFSCEPPFLRGALKAIHWIGAVRGGPTQDGSRKVTVERSFDRALRFLEHERRQRLERAFELLTDTRNALLRTVAVTERVEGESGR
ncbi:MAG: hypothetical protein U0169_22930 [Polyangiaceae bacterium]